MDKVEKITKAFKNKEKPVSPKKICAKTSLPFRAFHPPKTCHSRTVETVSGRTRAIVEHHRDRQPVLVSYG